MALFYPLRRFICSPCRICAVLLLLILAKPCKAQVSPDSPNSPVSKDTVREQPVRPITTDSLHHDSSRMVLRKTPIAPKKNIDTVKPVDTGLSITAAIKLPVADASSDENMLSLVRRVLGANPYFNFTGKPLMAFEQIHQARSFHNLFYFLVGLLFYFGLVKLFYGKYLDNLFTLFFRVTLRQQQIREQVLQAPQPSLLLNGLFIISGGMYACFLIRYHGFAAKTGFWLLLINCVGVLGLIYLVKFLLLKFSGWIFSIQRATDTYIFIVFLTNKILGIFLLPFLIMLSFSGRVASEVLITISLLMVLLFYAYRFIVSYGPIRKEIKVNGFHFFLYLCAFEIAPLLLIYKVLLNYLEKV